MNRKKEQKKLKQNNKNTLNIKVVTVNNNKFENIFLIYHKKYTEYF